MERDALTDVLSIESLRPLHEVNRHCVEYLAAAARGEGESFKLVERLGELLRGLSRAARQRAADRSFLLVDFGFRDAEWWRRIRAQADAATDQVGFSNNWRSGGFPQESARSLAHSTLLLAWHTTRANRMGALVLLGISSAVATELTALRLADLDRIADLHCDRVRPRWEDRPALWRQLLGAARDDDADAMREVTLYALQLLAGDLMPAVPPHDLRPAPEHSSRSLGQRH